MKFCLKEKEVAAEYVQDDPNVAIKIMHVCVCLEKCRQGHTPQIVNSGFLRRGRIGVQKTPTFHFINACIVSLIFFFLQQPNNKPVIQFFKTWQEKKRAAFAHWEGPKAVSASVFLSSAPYQVPTVLL